jgi:hypothetical protein
MMIVRFASLTGAKCKRCGERFQYYRAGRRRYFCEPCKELEKRDSNRFYNNKARMARLAARENAVAAHA